VESIHGFRIFFWGGEHNSRIFEGLKLCNICRASL